MGDLLRIITVLFVALQFSCAHVKSLEAATDGPVEIPRIMDSRPSQVIWHKGYVVSFNTDTRLPNWVAYELTHVEAVGTCISIFSSRFPIRLKTRSRQE